MRVVVKINDVDYVMGTDAASALVNVLSSAEVLYREYLGSSVPEADRWLLQITERDVAQQPLRVDLMDDERYEALLAIGKLRKQEKSK